MGFGLDRSFGGSADGNRSAHTVSRNMASVFIQLVEGLDRDMTWYRIIIPWGLQAHRGGIVQTQMISAHNSGIVGHARKAHWVVSWCCRAVVAWWWECNRAVVAWWWSVSGEMEVLHPQRRCRPPPSLLALAYTLSPLSLIMFASGQPLTLLSRSSVPFYLHFPPIGCLIVRHCKHTCTQLNSSAWPSTHDEFASGQPITP